MSGGGGARGGKGEREEHNHFVGNGNAEKLS